jgi:hypothetical protein
MADILTQPVITDTGSEEVAVLVNSYNNLVDTLGTLITTLVSVADVNAIKAAAVIAEAALVADVVKIQRKPDVPAAPKMAAY